MDLLSKPSSIGSSTVQGDRFLAALQGINTSGRPPVWLMRQAGRVLPDYRELRKQYSLSQLFHDARLITAVTRMPVDQLHVDAAILFADILHTVLLLGYEVIFPESGGPQIPNGPKTFAEVPNRLLCPLEILRPVDTAIRRLQEELEVPLIGFCGSPWTVACYLLGSSDGAVIKQAMWEDPIHAHRTFQLLTDASVSYLDLQIDAGVDAIQIFDSWATHLSHHDFLEYSLPYLRQITAHVHRRGVPTLLFGRGLESHVDELIKLPLQAISVAWQTDLVALHDKLPSSIAIQGNLDPELTRATPEIAEHATSRLLYELGGSSRFIVNLGHGLLPTSRLDTVRAIVETVRAYH